MDENTPSRKLGLRRLVAVAVASGLTIGLTGTAWALLPPAADEVSWFTDRPEPVTYPDQPDYADAPVESPTAAPAPAPEPPPPPPTPVDPPADPGQQEITEAQADQETREAIEEAIRLLKASDACKRLIGTSEPEVGPPVYPWDRIDELVRDQRIADTYLMPGPSGTPARIGPLDRPGVLPVLHIFREFHGEPSKELLYKVFGDGPNRPTVDYMFDTLGGTITGKELRALTILHEIAHLTGKLGDHGSEATAAVGWKFSSDIFTLCTRGHRTPTPPPSREDDLSGSGGGGSGFGGGDLGGGGWYDFGDGGTWPSGDPGSSDDPQGFDTDITIRDEDGGVLDGGETGDPNDPEYDPGYGGGDGSGYSGGGGGGFPDDCGWWAIECFEHYYVL